MVGRVTILSVVGVVATFASNIGEVRAQGQAQCSAALVPDTVSRDIVSVSEVVLASRVTESEYNSAKKNLGANAVIYGIPVGANYSEYQQNVRAFQNVIN